jgi:hypothetical protein
MGVSIRVYYSSQAQDVDLMLHFLPRIFFLSLRVWGGVFVCALVVGRVWVGGMCVCVWLSLLEAHVYLLWARVMLGVDRKSLAQSSTQYVILDPIHRLITFSTISLSLSLPPSLPIFPPPL